MATATLERPPVKPVAKEAPVLIGDDVWYWQPDVSGNGLQLTAAKILGRTLTTDEFELMLFMGGMGSVVTTFAAYSPVPRAHCWTQRKPEFMKS